MGFKTSFQKATKLKSESKMWRKFFHLKNKFGNFFSEYWNNFYSDFMFLNSTNEKILCEEREQKKTHQREYNFHSDFRG